MEHGGDAHPPITPDARNTCDNNVCAEICNQILALLSSPFMYPCKMEMVTYMTATQRGEEQQLIFAKRPTGMTY